MEQSRGFSGSSGEAPANIESRGLQVADVQESEGRLDVASMEAWSAAAQAAPAGSIGARRSEAAIITPSVEGVARCRRRGP